MRLICACIVFVAVCSFHVFAQQTGAAQQGNLPYDLWRVRSQTITDDLIKEAPDFTPSGRALLWARLAQRWWRDDPEKAHSWMLKPVEMVEAVPNKENASERNERLSTTRLLLRIVAPLDQKLSTRLVVVLNGDADHLADTERRANAEGLVEAAISIVDKDPKRAAELGALSLRIGQPTQIAWLISKLRPSEAPLSEALFTQALAVARQSLDREFLNSLAFAAFPGSMQGDGNLGVPSDALGKELLRLDLAFLQANPITPENRNSVCVSVGSFISPVMAQFERLLPQEAAIARQSVGQCQSANPLPSSPGNDGRSDQPLNTVDDLLKAADEATNSKGRTVYQYRAAVLAKEHNELDRAIKILDTMSIESREFMGGSWEDYRWEWAATSALLRFKDSDVYGMRLVLNTVPTDLQPYAKMAFVAHLPETKDKTTDPTLEFLNDARMGLRRSAVPDAEKCTWYFGLLKLTVKYLPAEATAVLKEAVAALNRAEQAKEKNQEKSKANSLDTSEISRTLPASLLEMDEYTVREAVSTISSRETRAQVRLELLGVCIQRMRMSKQAKPDAGTPGSKGE